MLTPLIFSYSYGGGFQDGESSIYNGSAIVAQSVARVSSLTCAGAILVV